jgi:hypothetical protein
MKIESWKLLDVLCLTVQTLQASNEVAGDVRSRVLTPTSILPFLPPRGQYGAWT